MRTVLLLAIVQSLVSWRWSCRRSNRARADEGCARSTIYVAPRGSKLGDGCERTSRKRRDVMSVCVLHYLCIIGELSFDGSAMLKTVAVT
jgi:hypothetical protein